MATAFAKLGGVATEPGPLPPPLRAPQLGLRRYGATPSSPSTARVGRSDGRASLAGVLAVPFLSALQLRRGKAEVQGRQRSACRAVETTLVGRPGQRLVFFGGKGGVGKTSSSSSYAAATAAQGQKVLIISTDPAHSLGDALSEPLTGKPRQVADNLFAVEVDPEDALQELRESLKALDAKALLDSLGLPGGTTAALGLTELSELLESPPPGVDEIAAIAKAITETEGFDVVVFDTAPTGHTLRLLEVPTFLIGFIDKALSVRKSIGGVLGMLGLGLASGADEKFDEAEKRVRSIRDRVAFLGSALKTPPPSPGGPPAPGATAEFVVVTRPTELDAAEAERLVRELKSQGICCRRLIVNQLIEEDSGEAYWKARVESQGQVLSELRSVCSSKSLPLYEVGDRPENLVGPPALGYLASLAFGDASALPKTQVTLFGGKGGVGKTSMSSAMAVKTAMDGQRVLIISTDPAHSLGDALGCKLSASAQAVENFAGSGELFAMEVDTAAAMKRFQETVRDALQRRQNDGGIVGQVLKQLPMQDFVDLFDTLPPGSDEIVALTEVLEKVEKENFDRIIIDTAPTGHAVRLLTYPDFLERLAERVARLRERFGWLSGESKGPDQVRSFQFRMIELQELFTDPDRSSFSVVTIPTTLALEETKRLLVQLEEQDIRCGLVIANRILDIEQVGQMAASQQKTQQVALEALESLAKKEGLEVVRVPYLDREVQGIYGLQYLGRNLVEA